MALRHLQYPITKKAKPKSKQKVKAKRVRIITSKRKRRRTPHSHKAPASSQPVVQSSPKPIISPMEEMMMVMMKIRSSRRHDQIPTSDSPQNCNTNNTNNIDHHIDHHHSPPICPAWKLYENPFYISNKNPNHQIVINQDQPTVADQIGQIHRLNLPVSARKIAASFWDLAFIRPVMETELEKARAQIAELRGELEVERGARRKLDGLNKILSRELSEERRARQALEKVCEELAGEVSFDKMEIGRMRREFEEERRMLRTAEVIREERVQMKLAEAKILLEEKFSELEIARKIGGGLESKEEKLTVCSNEKQDQESTFGGKLRQVLGEKKQAIVQRRKVSPESENPHIRRGIKGFVEFPRVVRAIGCRSGKHLGSSKLECQKAQLKILLKQKGPVRINGLITG